MIEFRTLGMLDLREREGRVLSALLAQPKRVAVFAYLALARPRGYHRRDALLGLFWPDADQDHARTSLRKALHVLRRAVGTGTILSRGDEEVALNPEAFWCDALALEAAGVDESPEVALTLYRGDLLTGFFLADAPEFERWLDAERTRYRGIAASLARHAATQFEKAENVTAALESARRAVELAEFDERNLRDLLELLDRLGDRASALRVYEEFASRLETEYGAEPASETRSVIHAIRARYDVLGAVARETVRLEHEHLARSPRFELDALPEIPGYTIERELAHGPAARVYVGHDDKHQRKVAIKILRPEISVVLGTQRFLEEIRLTATLRHPHIVPLYDSGVFSNLFYFVMPYITGETLRQRIDREGELSIEDAVATVRTLATALDFAHRQGVIHRDLKPENVLLDDGQPVLADFGIGLALREAGEGRLTKAGISLGTPQYMSPEQATGQANVGPATDIYSLGVIAYELLTGEPPFTGPTARAILARVAFEEPRSISTVRATVQTTAEAAVLKALAKLPADRFPTASEFAVAFEAGAFSAHGESFSGLRRRRRRSLTIMGVVSLLTLLVTLVLARPFSKRADTPLSARRQLTTSGHVYRAAISPDRQFIAYTVQIPTAGLEQVIVQDLIRGGADSLGEVGVTNTLNWSPDGTQLLLGTIQSTSIVLPRLGGSARALPVLDRYCATRASWLADGKRVSAHCAYGDRVWITNLETGATDTIRLQGTYTWLLDGSWSPTSDHYAVSTSATNPITHSIQIVGFDGQMKSLVVDTVALDSPRWSRTGDAVYYVRGGDALRRVSVSPRFQRLGPDVEIQTGLGALRTGISQRASFSLTSSANDMAYVRGVRYSNLWLVETATAGQQPEAVALTTGTSLRWSPVVSPDGRWIAFGEELQGVGELLRMPIDGGTPTRVTYGARVRPMSEIAWSPDGNHLAFQSVREGRAIVGIASTTDGQVIVFGRTRASIGVGHLTWAPGRHIAYQTAEHRQINFLDPATGNERPVVADSSPNRFFFSPRYAPDGHRLAFFWNRSPGDAGVWIFDDRDSKLEKIVDVARWPRGWSADGSYIILDAGPGLRLLHTGQKRELRPSDSPKFGDADCAPVGSRRPRAYVCATFDFTADAWLIENVDAGYRRRR